MNADDRKIYDAELVRIEAHGHVVEFRAVDRSYVLPAEHTDWWSVGEVGCLILRADPRHWGFHAYADQRLRRAPELDDAPGGRWGWKLGERCLTVKHGIVPGCNGVVVPEDTEPVSLDVPPEFIELCERHQLTPEGVLQAFIGDLCCLQNLRARPREDGYCSNGSDERRLAEEYFYRVFGWGRCDDA